jgi:hypothetical protein
MARKRHFDWPLAFLLLAGIASSSVLAAALPQFEQPRWAALTPEQRKILAPLADDWTAMDAFRRKKWIGIAQRYPEMTPAEQASMQRNMRDWALLTPEDRKLAREKFKALKKTPLEKRQDVKQKWEEYQSLPKEDRDRLRAKSPVRPTVARSDGKSVPQPPRSPLKLTPDPVFKKPVAPPPPVRTGE